MTRQAMVGCPYCGASSSIAIDPSGGSRQRYVEDCPVCCQPWEVAVDIPDPDEPQVTLRTLDE